MRKLILLFQKIRELPENNLILVISLFVTIIQITIIIYTTIFFIPIYQLEFLKIVYTILLIYFTIISLLRIISKNSIFRSFMAIDFFSILPSWILIIFFYNEFYELTGAIFFKGLIFLRLIPLLQILMEEKTFYLRKHHPVFFNKMISIVSISTIFFIFSGGILTSYLYNEYLKKEKENRINQITNLIKTFPLNELPQKIPNWILKIEQNQLGKLYEIYYIDKSFLNSSLIPNMHFTYLPGKNPTEGLLISFIDLYRNKNLLELVYLITSFLMLGCIYFILRYYYIKYVFLPIEKINTVIELRLKGEDVPYTDLTFIQRSNEYNEINQLISNIDALYKMLTELENS
ncbi:MAG: hypothetical protein KatS3mg129_2276 [Leptospiraceae bacterium]|nr:MAG: hypothetical protein KatS3mg129_2276 [Leptospiraceae bacterium]